MAEPLLVSKKEGAETLGISVRKLDYLIAEGKLAVRRIGRRVLVPRRAIEKFAAR